jgi:purine nucleosidase
MPKTFVIDTDTASDDAVALIMAFRHRDVDVRAVTVVAGNVPVDQGVRNALTVAELCDADVPVYRGAASPLLRPYQNATWFHGEDGLGDQGYPPPQRSAAEGHAVDALIRTIRANPGLTLVTLGPLTNIALAVKLAPDIAALVDRCVIMGGAAATFGNVTPAAEYNIWVDPEAARMVFHSGLPIEMVGWELCRNNFALNPDEMARVRALNTPYAHFTIDCNAVAIESSRQFDSHGLGLPDPVAMAVALDPTICTRTAQHFVEIETGSDLTRGATVVDALGAIDLRLDHNPPWKPLAATGNKATVCWDLDAARWKTLLFDLLA